MNSTINFITENHQWLFSGIGGTALIAFIIFIYRHRNHVTLFIQKIPINVYAILIVVILTILGCVLLPKKSSTITDAFDLLFGSSWEVKPYSDDIKLHCFNYQGKWELNKPYLLQIETANQPYLYYVAKTVTAYAWCQHISDKSNEGKKISERDDQQSIGNDEHELFIVELLKNHVYISDREVDSVGELTEENYIGKISGLFRDTIHFNDSGEPELRKGMRIGRHRYKLNDNSIRSKEILDSYMREAIDYIKELSPNCPVTTEGSSITSTHHLKYLR